MNRRDFVRRAPVAVAAVIAAPLAMMETRQRIHLSMDRESPFYVQNPRIVSRVLLDGQEIRHCVEASEIDGFVIQSVNQNRKNSELLRIPGAEIIPATERHCLRVRRRGNVRIVLKSDEA